jgi:arylsulfatase A-like enzyme
LIRAFLLLCLAGLACADSGSRPPNVVILLADDLGLSDLSRSGGAVPTRGIDSLFEQGVEVRPLLVAPVCSPSRAGLLTGRHPARVGIGPNALHAASGAALAREELTLAEAFGAAGYATALIGKWHLGFEPGPNEQGFDRFVGLFGAANDYFDRGRSGSAEPDWVRDGRPLSEVGYTTDLIREHAIAFMRENAERPFFLLVSFTALHEPLAAKPEDLARVPAAISDRRARVRAGALLALDAAVGAIVAAADEQAGPGTLIIFLSDNGPSSERDAGGLRGGKHGVYEGGVRSPLAVRWPGALPAGTRRDALMAIEDLYPTLLALAGVTRPAGPPLDGLDFAATLERGEPGPREQVFFIWRDADAIRTARDKLVRRVASSELYDLERDPQESLNLAAERPGRVRELSERLDRWEASIPVYPAQRPVALPEPARAEPEGEVLEVHVPSGARGPLRVQVAPRRLLPRAGDRLELDVYVPPGAPTSGFRFEIARRDGRGSLAATDAVDQHGQLVSDPRVGFPQAEGQWARRVIGLGSSGPNKLKGLWIELEPRASDDYRIYLDNVRVRRADGSLVELSSGPQRLADPHVRAVELSDLPGR